MKYYRVMHTTEVHGTISREGQGCFMVHMHASEANLAEGKLNGKLQATFNDKEDAIEYARVKNREEGNTYDGRDLRTVEGFCDHCAIGDADYVANPYDQDVHGEINMEWLCSDCYNHHAGEI